MDDYRFIIPRYGDEAVLQREFVDPSAKPGCGQVRVRHLAIGVNFIDIYYRSGLSQVSSFPSGIGLEAMGIVEAVGDGVTCVRAGDRVGYATGELGAYSTVRLMPADLLIPIPDEVKPELAAGLLTKGLTTEMLVDQCAKVTAGQIVLVHAAAGGVGCLLVQWLKSVGAFVIAHASTEVKAAYAKTQGADEALFCSYDQLPAEVRRITANYRADVVFESVGAASWAASLESVARTGLIVSFGNASGHPPPFSTTDLSTGSIFVTRPNTYHYDNTREKRCAAAAKIFEKVRSGELRLNVGQRFPLSRAVDAHRALESRSTIGSTVLFPDTFQPDPV